MLRALLSPAQRGQLFTIPADILEQDLVRRYTFSPADLSLISSQREAHNRIGFAVQLSYLRFPGRPLQAGEQVPYSLLSYVAMQLNLSAESFHLYATRDATRREHGAKIQKYLSLRQLTPRDELEIGKWLLPQAVQTGSNLAVIMALLEEFRTRKIIIPSVSTVERIADHIQDEATRELFRQLTGQLTDTHKSLLEGLLALRDRSQTHLVWLKNFPRRPTPQSVLSVIDRIEHIDALELPVSWSNLYENRLSKLARQESRHTPQYIQRLDPIRRYGTLVAIVTELRKDLIDQLITMHDKMIGQFFNRSELQQREAFHKRGKAINEKVLLYAKIGKALLSAKDEKSDWQEAISGVIPWEKFRASVEEAEALSMGENFDYLEHLRSRYSYLRQYVPRLLTALPMQATSPAQSLLAAVKLLKQLNETGKRAVPETAPTEFIKSRWEPYIFQGKDIDRQYYELHVLSELRNYFRSGDLWVERSREHKRFDTYLLSPADWDKRQATGQTGLAISSDGSGYLTERTHLLHQRLSDVNLRIAQNTLPEVTLENGTLTHSSDCACSSTMSQTRFVASSLSPPPRLKV